MKPLARVPASCAVIVTDGAPFNFVPYDYGPFDRAVYSEAETLQLLGLLTEEELQEPMQHIAAIEARIRDYPADVLREAKAEPVPPPPNG